MQAIKNYLVNLGPRNVLVQNALRIHARRKGFQVKFPASGIQISRKDCRLVLNDQQYVQVPLMMECFDLFFETIKPQLHDHVRVLDFSKPGLHEYTKTKLSFEFPSVPEDDVMDAYIKEYVPKEGDIVWDVGAHAGATAYFLSRMVGPSGRVYAFEPDESNYGYLLKNIEMHRATNIIPIKKALSGSTGRTTFNMDGTMSAGIHEFLVYSGSDTLTSVETITIEDACNELGNIPHYVKMDIEGAEVAAVEGSAKFLERHNIRFAIESYHRLGETYTHTLLDALFPKIGYKVQSGPYCGQSVHLGRKKHNKRES